MNWLNCRFPFLLIAIGLGLTDCKSIPTATPESTVKSQPLPDEIRDNFKLSCEEGSIFASHFFWEIAEKYWDPILKNRLIKGNWQLYQGPDLDDLMRRVNALGRLGILALDPGIVSRLTKFENFIRENPLQNRESLFQVRQNFNKALGNGGKIVLFRGMMLDAEQQTYVDRHGIRSGLMRASSGECSKMLTDWISGPLPIAGLEKRLTQDNVLGWMDYRLTNLAQISNRVDPLISASAFWQVTHAGAEGGRPGHHQSFGTPGSVFVRYQFSIDIVDTVPWHRTSEYFGNKIQSNRFFNTDTIEGLFSMKFWDNPGFEIFISKVISSKDFVKKEIYSVQPSWYGTQN